MNDVTVSVLHVVMDVKQYVHHVSDNKYGDSGGDDTKTLFLLQKR